MNALNTQALTDAEIEELNEFLYSDAAPEDALDYVGVHGLFCALNISAVPMDEASRLQLVFDGEPQWESEQQQRRIEQLLSRLYQSIGSDLYNDQEMEFPCYLTLEPDEDDEESELVYWAQGFMEVVFEQEEDWFGNNEAEVAEMLLPIMLASDLFDEPEMQEMRQDRALVEDMANQIPELLVDLYLYFHAPEK